VPRKPLLLDRFIFGKAPEDQLIRGDFNMLGPPGIGEIGAEGPPDKGHIKPHETHHRPGPDHIKKHANREIETHDHGHQDQKSFARKRAVRRDDGPPGFRLGVVHAMTLRSFIN
jgi:hypothetical protein